MLQEIDTKLGKSIFLSTGLNSFVQSSIVYDDPVPMNSYFHEGDLYFDFFIRKVLQKDDFLVESLGHVHIGNITVITEKNNNPLLRLIHENIDSIPSMVLDEFYTHKGDLIGSYRFHERDSKKVTDLVREIASLDTDVTISKLGETKGLIWKLEKINMRLPLTVLSFTYNKTSKTNSIIEWKNIEHAPLNSISYDLDDPEKIEPFDSSQLPTASLLKSIAKDHIPLAGYFEHHNKMMANCIVVIPSMLTKAFLVRFFAATEGIEGLSLNFIEDYNKCKGSL